MKRTAEFIPYRIVDSQAFLFLQKRTIDAPFAPGLFGIFGGQIEESESPEAALFREVEEELNYRPENVTFLRKFEHYGVEQYVYLSEVDGRFETQITVLEGQYGKFLSQSQVATETIVDCDQAVLAAVFRHLSVR